MSKKITLLLGAGSSLSMGYPVGASLRSEIIQFANNRYKTHICDSMADERDLNLFVEQFKLSQMESIDAFLARRPNFSEIGKRAIAAILLDKENERLLHSSDHTDNWYRYFFNKITSDKWEKLDFSNISIVTFNYDRSLEFYLTNAMKASYGKSFDSCCDKLKELKIIHVYGTLGESHPRNTDYFYYGEKINRRRVDIAASKLKVIPEGRQDDETLNAARKELLSADRIGFLGFGFDSINLQRLDSKVTCSRIVETELNGKKFRTIHGTCVGMTDAEIHKASNMTIGASYEGCFYKTGCLQMLRETLLID